MVSDNSTFVKTHTREVINRDHPLSEEIKNYDISNFTYKFRHQIIYIYPDEVFMKLYKRYCDLSDLYYRSNLNFSIELTNDPISFYKIKNHNQLDIQDSIQPELRGLFLAYRFSGITYYKIMIYMRVQTEIKPY
jgi:hypothetical protein